MSGGEDKSEKLECCCSGCLDCSRESSGESGSGNGNEEEENGRNGKVGWGDVLEFQLKHLGQRGTWLAIILGQVLSVLLCVMAFATVHLVEVYKVYVPNAQNFPFYLLLAIVFIPILCCRPGQRNLFPILRTRGWKYLIVAIADAESNYLITKAYQLTTLTSVQLLDCFTIPTVLSLSWLMLKIRFKVAHILGVSISLFGVSCLVWADIETGPPQVSLKNRFLGDMLCLSGAFLLGFSNIAQEFVVKTFDTAEFLGMIGLFGSVVSGIQTLLLEEYEVLADLEIESFENIFSPPVSTLIVYILAKFLFCCVATVVIKYSGATFLSLSLLSADFYSLILSIYYYNIKFHALYFLSYVLVMTGAITFSIKPTILGSHVYKSLTREHTTTLDLELLAQSPTENGYQIVPNDNVQKQHQQQYFCQQQANKNCHCQCGSLLLSKENCDVVMQTTNSRIQNEGLVPEETC